ncbi:MAG: ATP-binding protein [Bacteroidales bacterium]|jgi:serine/threonine-protein kinase RsbW|nr:ATP-binding protein [Bacteroidales bacterium]
MERLVKITSEIDNLHIIERIVDDLLASFGIDQVVYGNLMVASMEAANNAITHGNKLNPEKYVAFTFSIDDEKLVITVKDEGSGFDYTRIPDPTSPENIENVSGRGVFLMSKLSDKLEFEDNGSFVKMTFLLKKIEG